MEELTAIHFARSGGFAGFNMKTSINLLNLPEAEASKLKSLIRNSEIRKFRSSSFSKPGTDLFIYTITLETPDHSETVVIDQQHVDSKTEPLISYLSNVAKKRR